MTQLDHCTLCGRSQGPDDWLHGGAADGVAYDRDGDPIWDATQRYCATCGARLSTAERHSNANHVSAQRPVIRFYSAQDEYGEFSNFAGYEIRLQGRTWPTTEHYFQAQKFAGTKRAEEIRLAHSPMKAAKLGRSRLVKLRSDWESVKIQVMRDALRAKFTQHDELRELLLETGDALIVEHTGNDAFWGNGADGSGKNWLGRLLMQLRSELRAEP